ncbi:hypothetical protein T492DRAFT_1138433 [Pavlovales sp. CCMP2436]|nr:hypothetical protein T492DRAFT_1138433 [Pavlovales sp. CCMP2436]
MIAPNCSTRPGTRRPQTHDKTSAEYQVILLLLLQLLLKTWHKKSPQTHGADTLEYQDCHKVGIKRGAQTKALNLALNQHITLEEAQFLVAQHPACPCPTCGHTAFRPKLMKRHLLRTHRPLVRTALHIPPDGAVALRNFKVVHRVPTNTWSVIRWHYN